MNAATEFEFLFVVDGVSVDDDQATALLTGDFDGVLSSNRAPEGTAGRSLVWRWADVNGWLTPLGLGDGAVRPTRADTALIDVMLLAPAALPASSPMPAALKHRTLIRPVIFPERRQHLDEHRGHRLGAQTCKNSQIRNAFCASRRTCWAARPP
jgi:hypothetical protein